MHRASRLLAGCLALAVLAACAAGPPRPGQYLARNNLQVVPLDDETFEVIARPGSVGRDYFCAAADYARVRLDARATDRVVVTRADGPSFYNPGGRAAAFTVRPAGTVAPSGGFTVRANRVGNNHTVGHARALCPDPLRDGFSVL